MHTYRKREESWVGEWNCEWGGPVGCKLTKVFMALGFYLDSVVVLK